MQIFFFLTRGDLRCNPALIRRKTRNNAVHQSSGGRERLSPRVDDVKYSSCDRCGVLGVKVRVGLKELQPRVVQQQFPDEWLQVVLRCVRTKKNKHYQSLMHGSCKHPKTCGFRRLTKMNKSPRKHSSTTICFRQHEYSLDNKTSRQ